jgi:hypothetical protein
MEKKTKQQKEKSIQGRQPRINVAPALSTGVPARRAEKENGASEKCLGCQRLITYSGLAAPYIAVHVLV